MKSKNYRLDLLRMILSNQEHDSQQSLLQALKDAGLNSTQTTLSRDLRTLKVVKVMGANGKYYALPEGKNYRRVFSNNVNIAAEKPANANADKSEMASICRQLATIGKQFADLGLQLTALSNELAKKI